MIDEPMSLTVRAALMANLHQVAKSALEGQQELEREREANTLLRAALEDANKEIGCLTEGLVELQRVLEPCVPPCGETTAQRVIKAQAVLARHIGRPR